MNDAEFLDILNQLGEYLKANKAFIKNPFRAREFETAVTLAHKLFPDAKIEIEDDPLQMGAMMLSITDYYLDVTEINLFVELIKLADNWEIHPIDNETVCLAAVFQKVFVRI